MNKEQPNQKFTAKERKEISEDHCKQDSVEAEEQELRAKPYKG